MNQMRSHGIIVPTTMQYEWIKAAQCTCIKLHKTQGSADNATAAEENILMARHEHECGAIRKSMQGLQGKQPSSRKALMQGAK